MVFGQIRLTPTQKIRIFPTMDRLFSTGSVIYPDSTTARAVISPYQTATGIKEKIQPFPMEEAIINTMTKSSMAFATSVVWSP